MSEPFEVRRDFHFKAFQFDGLEETVNRMAILGFPGAAWHTGTDPVTDPSGMPANLWPDATPGLAPAGWYVVAIPDSGVSSTFSGMSATYATHAYPVEIFEYLFKRA